MTLKNIMASTAVATLLAGCSASAGSDEKIIDKPEFTSATGVFEPMISASFSPPALIFLLRKFPVPLKPVLPVRNRKPPAPTPISSGQRC